MSATALATIANPYYTEFNDKNGWCRRDDEDSWVNSHRLRREMVRKYSWSVPTIPALQEIAAFTGKIVSIGAGTGYWEMLLRQCGVDVIAFDREPAHTNTWGHTKPWIYVQRGSAKIARKYPDRTLMLSWPPYKGNLSSAALEYYQGDKVVFIGESFGCTGNNKFHGKLCYEWDLHTTVNLPHWPDICDKVYLYTRKESVQ